MVGTKDLMRDVVRAKDAFNVVAQGWRMTFADAVGVVSSAFQASRAPGRDIS